MKANGMMKYLLVCLAVLAVAACGVEKPVDVKEITSQPKIYVGSDTCKMCHLEHYDSWKMTLHSRMTQDAQANRDAIIVSIDDKEIRKALAKLGDELKVPVDKIYIPKVDEIKYTIGSQWDQQYLIEKDGTLYIAPIQYSAESNEWKTYHEEDWDKRPWLKDCGGCHATGVDLEKQTFSEPGVGCESCHGKGSWHAALPKTAVFEKRNTIINPSKLTLGVSVQICGACHTRGKPTQHEGAGWPVGYEPGKALESYFVSPSIPAGDVKQTYADYFSQGHHQTYLDWQQSQHFKEGVTCASCHYVHQIGLPPTRSQTVGAGSQQCFECHVQLNKTSAHAIHSFANCVGCHMPRIAESEESGATRSHVFVALVPKDTLVNPVVPNSCQACHKHKDADLKKLQEQAFPGSMADLEGGGGW